jgi:hypothetical protein
MIHLSSVFDHKNNTEDYFSMILHIYMTAIKTGVQCSMVLKSFMPNVLVLDQNVFVKCPDVYRHKVSEGKHREIIKNGF